MAHIEPVLNAEVGRAGRDRRARHHRQGDGATAAEHAARLAGKPMVSMANAMRRVGVELRARPHRGGLDRPGGPEGRARGAGGGGAPPHPRRRPAGPRHSRCSSATSASWPTTSRRCGPPRPWCRPCRSCGPLDGGAAGERHRPRGVLRRAPHRQRPLRRARRPCGSCRLARLDRACRSASTTPPGGRSSRSSRRSSVRIYVCGITPYDSTHLGHAATYLTYDVLIRRLEELGHEVALVRNVTDVDDSILPKARQLGVNYLELAEAEMARFRSDMEALGMRPPVAEPRATEAVPQIIELVGEAARERATPTRPTGSVFFDISTFPDYGALSHYSREEMLAHRRRAGRPARRPGQARPARLHPVAAVGARRAGLGRPLRPRPPGLAHRVLGHGPGRPRAHPRPPRRRHRPDLPPPRERDRPEHVDHRPSHWPGTGCTRRWSPTRARR